MPLNFPTNPTTNQTYTFNTVTWVWTGTRWALGGNNDGSELFKGYLDQVRFFNKALSAAEALQLYNHENPRS